MSLSDPIGDMLSRIRNGLKAGLEAVEMPGSRIKGEIARILKKEGYVADYVVEGGVKKTLRVYLKYTAKHEPVIQNVKRESTPGLRRYSTAADIPRRLGGMGLVILSTSEGLMSGRDAAKKGIGGEIVCSVW